jgi:hypothetical protein
MDFHVVEECDIEVVEEEKNDGNRDEDMYIVQTFEVYEANEKREICENSINNIDDEYVYHECDTNRDIFVELREIELLINTSTADEVVFKKHRVEIINKHTRECMMEGVVVGYDIVGEEYDPNIILKFEDGRRFYNENFGYLLRFYI